MKENLKKNNLIILLIVLFLGMFIMYFAIYKYPQKFSTIVTKEEKKVTVTDTGISDAVSKIYDAVVVVTAYHKNGSVSSGTGFVYEEKDNYANILTNSHVVENAVEVYVKFSDGHVEKTEVLGNDKLQDVAVLKVSNENLMLVAEIGSSDNLKVGDTLFAVGGPLDQEFSWTVTRGILSGKDRIVDVDLDKNGSVDHYMKVMQTDTAINNGNSGGPLCNSNGEVIGINTLKLKDEGIEGMGFAIPIEDAVLIANKITSNKNLDKENPFLGISMLDLSVIYHPKYDSYANIEKEVYKSDIKGGVLIDSVEKNSPADKAGIIKDDIIYKINNIDLNSSARFRYELYKFNKGDEVKLTILRNGKTVNLKVKLK